jgi:hypothetical protein
VIGLAAERGDGKVLLVESNGSLVVHVQKLEILAHRTCALSSGFGCLRILAHHVAGILCRIER